MRIPDSIESGTYPIFIGMPRLFNPFHFTGLGQKTERDRELLPFGPTPFCFFVCTLPYFDPPDQFKEQRRRQLVDILILADQGAQMLLLLPQARISGIRLQRIALFLQLGRFLFVSFEQRIEICPSYPAR